MGKVLPGLVISFVSQKGGCGKTTLTAMFANYLNTIGKKKGLTVAVIDCDDFQRSFLGIRERELASAEITKEQKENMYDVYAINSNEFKDHIVELKEKYDIILVDFPGNMVQEGVITMYYLLDFAVIPVVPTPIDFSSTLKFLEKFKEIIKEKKEKFNLETSYVGILNKVNKNEKESKEIINSINNGNLGIPFLDHSISDLVSNRRAASTMENKVTFEQRCVFDEIILMLTLHVQKSKK